MDPANFFWNEISENKMEELGNGFSKWIYTPALHF